VFRCHTVSGSGQPAGFRKGKGKEQLRRGDTPQAWIKETEALLSDSKVLFFTLLYFLQQSTLEYSHCQADLNPPP
jgi:hypothetical protein